MQNTTAPQTLIETLERMRLSDLLNGYVAPERVRRWNFLDVQRFAAEYSYEFAYEGGGVYGRLMLVPVTLHPVPPLRIITRSDHAAVHPSRPRRAA